MKRYILAILLLMALVVSSFGQLTNVNVGSYVGDPLCDSIRNAFIKENGNWSWVGTSFTTITNRLNLLNGNFNAYGTTLSNYNSGYASTLSNFNAQMTTSLGSYNLALSNLNSALGMTINDITNLASSTSNYISGRTLYLNTNFATITNIVQDQTNYIDSIGVIHYIAGFTNIMPDNTNYLTGNTLHLNTNFSTITNVVYSPTSNYLSGKTLYINPGITNLAFALTSSFTGNTLTLGTNVINGWTTNFTVTNVIYSTNYITNVYNTVTNLLNAIQTITNGVVADYELNGNLLDSISGNYATSNSAYRWTDGSGGIISNSLMSSNNLGSITLNDYLPISNKTVSIWYKYKSINYVYNNPHMWDASGSGYQYLYFYDNNTYATNHYISFTAGAGQNLNCGSGDPFNNNWHNVVITESNGVYFGYFDATNFTAFSPAYVTEPSGAQKPVINFDPSSTNMYIDQINVWNRPLYSNEVYTLYSAINNGVYTNVVTNITIVTTNYISTTVTNYGVVNLGNQAFSSSVPLTNNWNGGSVTFNSPVYDDGATTSATNGSQLLNLNRVQALIAGGSITNNWTGGPIILDSANANTNELGGLMTVLGYSVQSGSGTSIGTNSTGEILPASGYATSQGYSTTAGGFASHSEGHSSVSSGNRSHAEGWLSTASGNASHAENRSTASGDRSHSEGNTTASGDYSHAEGYLGTASGYAAHAEGDQNTAAGDNSHVEGFLNTVSALYGHAEGAYNTITGIHNNTTNQAAHVEGLSNTVAGAASHAAGKNAYATNNNTFVWSDGTYMGSTTSNQFTVNATNGIRLLGGVIYGNGAGITNTGAITNNWRGAPVIIDPFGLNTNKFLGALTILGSSVQEGISSATNSGAHSEGNSTTAGGVNSHAEGNTTYAQGDSAHAEGHSCKATNVYAHAEGEFSIAGGYASHAEGELGNAKSEASHVEGILCNATNIYAHAEGSSVTAGGYASHGEGESSKATGEASHAEGFQNVASGYYSHAEGSFNTASGIASWAGGNGCSATNPYSYMWSDGANLGITTTASYQYNVYASGGINLMSGKITGNGAGITNVPRITQVSTWSGPTNLVSLTNSTEWFYVTAGNVAITNVVGGAAGTKYSALLTISNATGGAVTSTWTGPGYPIGIGSTNILTIPAGKEAYYEISVRNANRTNYVNYLQN